MKNAIEKIFAQSVEVKQQTLKKNLSQIISASELIISTLKSGHKLFLCGNGGSAADSQHIAAEFVGRFQKERKAWPAIALTTDSSALTALGNDYSFDIVFARQLQALGQKGDCLIAISTSGNSKNVLEALRQAKASGIATIGVTGGAGGQLAGLCDIAIIAASNNTARIQESHLVIFHTICELVENTLA
ncbi:MAG: D-sedoheptulose 7-phosphate isomerase [Candidatus Omnitrophica bacterium]|nr:D-sedoheptulose 7-phosphate isomerase [Candidatus Omnitrophota bacterium]MDE2010221.1 D-sedoheptulose 7-phosphate isomerase [Candidatus Omnitrophota bacterium]MDE2215333.1 D-sedoheptulose 7-phosphate isomerase [Candidatus Omnitrophota bacterium]MDE2231715.1 D-sedoheptulose 7-phosphate isomerase [Candidatus Omnitrophota bacterium]